MSSQQLITLFGVTTPSVLPNTSVPAISPSSLNSENEETFMPWDDDDWVPRTKSGQQKSPNMIRNELQRYIDECKASGTSTQTAIISAMGVNNNSFRRFMNPKTYKNQWSALENSTYWAAARLLEKVKFEKQQAQKTNAPKSNGKRKATTDSPADLSKMTTPKKSKAASQLEALELIKRIDEVEGVSYENGVYDSCPELVVKIKDFLQRDGMTKSLLLLALGGQNSNSLNRFLAGKSQDQCANVIYRTAYEFFEKLRILEGQPKSSARLRNEMQRPNGFVLKKYRGSYIVPVGYTGPIIPLHER